MTDITRLSKKIDAVVCRVTLEIISTHQSALIDQPVEYIAPAIWGAKMGGHLDQTQEAISALARLAEDEIKMILDLPPLSDEQDFGFSYLIKWLFISRIAHMREIVKSQCSVSSEPDNANPKLPLH